MARKNNKDIESSEIAWRELHKVQYLTDKSQRFIRVGKNIDVNL